MPAFDRHLGLALLRGFTMATQRRAANHVSHGFTLVELLVVITIVLAVSAIALPTVLSALKDRQAGDAARILHAAIYGARDAAQNAGSPRGLRFLPDESIGVARLASGQLDPSKALASGSWVQTEIPPDYETGLASIWPGTDYSAVTTLPCLVLEEQPGHWEPAGTGYVWTLNEPTNWWNVIRLGERLTLKGQVFTVCGPMRTFNPELFVNALTPFTRTYTAPNGTQQTAPAQYLFLVNGKDDNGDGFIDNGWDGLDNDNLNGTDDAAEWEIEQWPTTLAGALQGSRYSISRRPAPTVGQQATTLPSSVVIDLTTWSTSGERSHLPVNPFTGQVDLLVEPDGSVRPDLPYGTRSSQGMGSAFLHFWLADRGDVHDPVVTQGSFLTLPIPPVLTGSRYLVQVQARSGRTTVGPLETFAIDPTAATAPAVPFLEYRQGF
jgi:prepilin-type N-terminal cleavage/methylation domain-containing protein